MTQVVKLRPDLLRLRAPNASALTGSGTNTYVLGTSELCVIDPGPEDDEHLDAILRQQSPDLRITRILVTHSHLDHSPLARALSKATSAPIMAYGSCDAGRSKVMDALSDLPDLGGGEGRDTAFVPDICLTDGADIQHDNVTIRALWTPGHFGNHMCFAWKDVLFSGDLVMGWSTSLVSPPDGDLTDFMASCQRLLDRTDTVYFPGHGDPVTMPQTRVSELIQHRLGREAQILSALASGPATPRQLTEAIYTDVSAHLWPAAERNVLAHLIHLLGTKQVTTQGNPSAFGFFEIT